jgi:hypothetical protein
MLVIGAVGLGLCAVPLGAEDRLVVPLSDPAKPAALNAALVIGSIRVMAGQAGEVTIEALAQSGDYAPDEPLAGKAKDKTTKEEMKGIDRGLRRIPNTARDLVAEEEGNEVSVRSGPRPVDLRISVPAASSLRLSTVSGGELEVEGITGELELHNTNGGIRVRGARGPVTANTVNGTVEIALGAGPLPGPMAFSTLNGDVDLTLAPGTAVSLRVRTDHGEIYSDFDVELAAKETKTETGGGARGRYRVSIARELVGSIGGGGPEIYLKSFNGDIVLRAAPQ